MTASAPLIAEVVGLTIADLGLIAVCPRRRAVLAGAGALAGLLVLLGAALFGLGEAVERVLEDPDDGGEPRD